MDSPLTDRAKTQASFDKFYETFFTAKKNLPELVCNMTNEQWLDTISCPRIDPINPKKRHMTTHAGDEDLSSTDSEGEYEFNDGYEEEEETDEEEADKAEASDEAEADEAKADEAEADEAEDEGDEWEDASEEDEGETDKIEVDDGAVDEGEADEGEDAGEENEDDEEENE